MYCRVLLALNENELFHKIRQEKLSLRLIKDESAANLLEKMLSKNQDHRPSCEEILNNPWLLQQSNSMSAG